MSSHRSNLVDVGRIAGVFGVKGWLKVNSNTDPAENIVSYSPWWVKTRHGVKEFEVDDYQFNGGTLIVHFKGIDDRDVAAQYTLSNVAVERSQMPELEDNEFYWHQLIGLKVINKYQGQESILGRVSKLMETGANDVLVVSSDESSIDERERLIPYAPDEYVLSVDTEAGEIWVSWDPDF
ncbi:ribosome maturation factor RimM [Agarilytica rhodophyticola]|uniref:ribosome maturation factor RimM n=1 Tax=Agarilytica rhodophyticola TaxID=1737490 RepID=UPI000B342A12|nr:ribosome maturation factor RimM [Agarilytica rhodophyticola]